VTVKVSPSEDLLAVAVSLGEYHTCALTSGGGVKCWGDNTDGQLGFETLPDNNSTTPKLVSGLDSGVKAVSAGGAHTCALTLAGGVKCWGNNSDGQLGDEMTTNRLSPVDVVGLSSGVKAVSAGGNHTCALTSGGMVKCWGYNDLGQLGDGTTTRVTTAVDVVGLTSGMKEVSAGFQYTCALTDTGGVKCWGNKYYGLSGDWMNTSSSTPVDVDGLTSGVKGIGTGKYHTCAITETNSVKCWGYNGDGQLGDETFYYSLIPVDVVGFTGEVVIAVTAGDDHTCALTDEGVVKCWGSNNFYQLGDGTTEIRSNIPVDIDGFGKDGEVAIAISAGANHTCAITQTGGLKCWGYNQLGQLGNVTPYCDFFYCSKTPVDVDGFDDAGEDAIAISAGGNHTCAITTTGGVQCWGYNEFGQLGNSLTTDSSIPVDVVGLSSNVISVSAGDQHTCAVTSSGAVKCWGYNYDGQLGDSLTTDSSIPVDVVGLSSGVKAVSAGTGHTCAITGTDGVKCWGDNTHGQLGWRLIWVPVDVIGFIEIVDFVIYLPVIVRK
jgi:alpha-tubulin suppressor-like RCC1 family protein